MLNFGFSRTQNFEEISNRWHITPFPKYSFSPLDSSWEPHPMPTDNCVIFYGKKDIGTHIGVFLHELPDGMEPIYIIESYIQDDPVSNRTLVLPITQFGVDGFIAACENKFKSLGAEVRAIESFVVIPTSSSIVIGCTFKKRIEVHSCDYRREEGEKVLENIANTIPEHGEFLSFCKSFIEEK